MLHNTNFAYAVGRIRAIEKRLIDKGRYDKIIDASSTSEALRLINESGYGFSETKAGKSVYFDEVLKEEQQNLFRLFDEILKDDDIFEVFKLKGDYHNVKVVLKSELLNIEADETIFATGTGDWKVYRDLLLKRQYNYLPGHISSSYRKALNIYEETGDARQIDLLVDSDYYKFALDVAQRKGCKAVIVYLKTKIDLINIKTFLRIKALDLNADLLDRSLISGGHAGKEVFVESFNLNIETFPSALGKTLYTELVKECVDDYLKKGNFSGVEKLLDDFLIDLVKKSKYTALGPEPLLGYLVGKENEILNLRIILTGKMNDLAGSVIRERLRQSYV